MQSNTRWYALSRDDKKVKYVVQMPEKLRTDAKRSTEHGELAEAVRELFRRKAYGEDDSKESAELEHKQDELEDLHRKLYNVRQDRDQLNKKINYYWDRITRLEEQIKRLEEGKNDE